MPNPSLGELFTQTWQKIDQMKLHVCLSGEYNVTTLVPTVDYPEENTFYLVPDGTGNNVYTEWVYINNNWERFGQASIDLSDYVQKTDYATNNIGGVVCITDNNGISIDSSNHRLYISKATTEHIKAGTQNYRPIVSNNVHEATFYGLAKAAGDSTQASSDNAVGTYTTEAKAAIQSMLGIGMADTTNAGLVKLGTSKGIMVYEGILQTEPAGPLTIKTGTNTRQPIVPYYQDEAVFYGLATAAGDVTQKASDNAVGTYTADAKAAIQSMLGIGIASSSDFGLVKVDTGLGIGIDGTSNKLFIDDASEANVKAGTEAYKPITPRIQHNAVFYGLAKAAGDSTQAASNNAVGAYTDDAKAAIQSMLGLGVASSSNLGLVKIATSGTGLYCHPTSGELSVAKASSAAIKNGTNQYSPIVPSNQHESIFYGLATAAGDATQKASDNAVGTYTSNAKLAINNMLGTAPISYIDGFIENEEGIKVYEFEDVESTSTTGKYIDFNGSIATSSSFSYTAPIQVHKADVVYVTAQGYTNNIAMIAWAESSSADSFIPLTISDSSTTKEYFADIPEDGYITCSYKTSEEITITIKRKFSNDALDHRTEFIEEIMPNLMSFTESADFNILTNQTEATVNQNGKYIDKNGNVQTSNNYIYTNAIALPANSTILFGAQGYLTNVALLAKDNGDSTYTPLVVSTDNSPHSFTYHTKSAVNVVISTNKFVIPTYIIVSSKLDKAVLDTDYATDTTPGLVKVNAGHGVTMDSDGVLQLTTPTASQLQALTNGWLAPRLNTMHTATFYSLAKAAGDTTQSISNNAVGLYTDNAKASIQKMIGTYEAPWELIREDTFTNDLTTASDHIITVDGNGDAFELTDVLMLFELPTNEYTAEKGFYGQIWFYYDDDTYIAAESLATTREANGASKGAWYRVTYQNKLVFTETSSYVANSNTTNWRVRYIQSTTSTAGGQMGIFVADNFAINKINIRSVKGEGHYKLYGRRKWWT